MQYIGPSGVCALPLAAGINEGGHYFRYIFGPSVLRAPAEQTKVATVGPSGVRALPLAAGTNEGGHYFGPSGVRALPLAAGTNEGGHYFRYFGPSGAVQTVSDSRRPLF